MQTRLDRMINFLTLATATVAILISLYSIRVAEEANSIARDENELVASGGVARVLAINSGIDPTYVSLSACRVDTRYRVFEFTQDGITFVNNGGRVASLLDIHYVFNRQSEGFAAYVSVEPYEENTVRLPLDIESGVARRWFFRAERFTFFETKDAVFDYIDSLELAQLTAGWVFTFSNGYIDTYHPSVVWLTVNPSLNRETIERPCSS